MTLITPRRPRLLQAGLWAVCTAGFLAAAGCEKRLDPQEYGEVVEGLPKVEGADKTRPLPELQGEDKVSPAVERFLK